WRAPPATTRGRGVAPARHPRTASWHPSGAPTPRAPPGPRARPPPSGLAALPPSRRSSPSGGLPPGSAASVRRGCGSARSSVPSRASANASYVLPDPGRIRAVAAELIADPTSRSPASPRRGRRSGPTPAATPHARSRRAALAPSRPAACRRAGAAWASFEDDQDLALLDDLAFLHAHLFDGARPRRGDRDFHLHRLEDEQLILFGDLRPWLGLHLPHAADELRLDLGHDFFRQRIVRASPIEATGRPRSRASRAAFSTSSPLLLAIRPSST